VPVTKKYSSTGFFFFLSHLCTLAQEEDHVKDGLITLCCYV